MTINLTADLVVATDNGMTIKELDFSTVPEPFRSKLIGFLDEVRARLASPSAQLLVPPAGSPPTTVLAQYKLLLQDVFQDAVASLDIAPGNAASSFAVSLGTYVKGSVWRPQIEFWDFFPGAAWGLDLKLEGLPGGGDFSGQTEVALNVRPVVAEDSNFCNYELLMVDGGATVGVAIFTSVSRGRVVSMGLAAPPERSRLPAYGRGVFTQVKEGMWVSTGPIHSDRGQIVVQVQFQGDPPHVRGVTALTDGGPVPDPAPDCPSPTSPFPAPPGVADAGSLEVLETYAYAAADFFNYRAGKVRLADDHKPAREFFLALDTATRPGTAEFNVNSLGGILMSHYLRRAEAHHFGETFDIGGPGLRAKAQLAAPAGTLIRSLMGEHLGDDGSGDLSAIRSAFECFASGELMSVDTLGAPNGTNIFSFAELALVHMESGDDADVWARLLPVFGEACEIFAGCFYKCAAPRAHCSYRIENNLAGERAPSQSAKDEIWKLWNLKNMRYVKARYDRLVYSALMDDMIEALQTPASQDVLTIQNFGCPTSFASILGRGLRAGHWAGRQ